MIDLPAEELCEALDHLIEANKWRLRRHTGASEIHVQAAYEILHRWLGNPLTSQ